MKREDDCAAGLIRGLLVRCRDMFVGFSRQQYKIYGSTGIVLMLGIYGSPERG